MGPWPTVGVDRVAADPLASARLRACGEEPALGPGVFPLVLRNDVPFVSALLPHTRPPLPDGGRESWG